MRTVSGSVPECWAAGRFGAGGYAGGMRDKRLGLMPLSFAVALAFAVAVAALVAACDQAIGSPPSTARPSAAAPAETSLESEDIPTLEPLDTSATLEPEPTVDDTGSAGTPPCALGDLKASHGINEVDADDRTTELVLVAADTCSVTAYPSLLLQDDAGHVLFAANALAPGAVDLVGGVAYRSEVRLSNWCLGEPNWPVTIGIVHGTGTVKVTGDSFPDEGDLPVCVHQDADPILLGSAWTPSS